MQFEQAEVTSADVADYVPASGWLDVEPRYLAGIVLVVVVVVLAGLGVVPLPGGSPLGGVDVDTDAVETAVRDELAAEREAVGNDPTARDPALSAAAAAHAAAMADEGELSTVAAGGRTVADRVAAEGAECGTPVAVVAQVSEPGAFDGASDVARGLVDHWLDDAGHRGRLLGADVERSGVGVVLEGGRLWVAWVGC